ncbi:protein mono-ADP-ribosyltransferase PARP3 [Latimeria chalumnae]|uniref:Poly [ADP-ribose] polymerase n=1 Tax=Latimeria chalumnae TaxID=7897 RepID=H3BCR5_LATCH|nr:PREDICTED: poly [ADP-ribose] polymerase 3 [Latimeria chalumnae]|eukprot:XP_014344157.1 PREDICTED: poly [ADP-ribose] polymerase 3 [Latimeria chalumnae]
MPPKRKAASSSKRAKKGKVEPQEDTFRSTVEALKAAPKEKVKTKIDSACSLSHDQASQVYEDYDCMLNQTNIGHNNNKFYIIQLIEKNGAYFCWNRWGRVGEVGQSKLSPANSLDAAKKDFEKKFKDKTKNDWSNRENFTAHAGKYTMIEVEAGDEGEVEVKIDAVDGGKLKKVRPCTLNNPTQDLVSLIFNNDMFKDAMETMNLDVKKMPLGKLSKQQIAKGFEALEEIEASLQKKGSKKQLEELCSKFYTIIPHNFGRMRPPVISTTEVIQAKKDMLLVLADIVLAKALQAEKESNKKEDIEEVPHPLDEDYQLLKCELSLLEPDIEEYKIIKKYIEATGSTHRTLKLLNAWKVNREGESERFSTHDDLDNRRLLWHGTSIAVIAAILKSGLRIMPHSGGRVGRGIYFASENGKSSAYVGTTSNSIGIMFLGEVALGKEYHITTDDSSLRAAPPGYNCVVARGCTEPDPSKDTAITVDGKKVVVPQGKPIRQDKFASSNFSQSEYVIYKENQCRIRYLLQLKF